MKLLTHDQVLERLAYAIKRAGTQAAAAKLAGVSYQFLNDVVRGARPPGTKVCEALGVRRVIRYEIVGSSMALVSRSRPDAQDRRVTITNGRRASNNRDSVK